MGVIGGAVFMVLGVALTEFRFSVPATINRGPALRF
jgi:hypothetical protein